MSFRLNHEEGRFLVELARKAVQEYLRTKKRVDVPEKISRRLLEPCGVFVTINSVKREEKGLRGCIGFPYPTTPLAQAVVESAISAATQDPRFPPMSVEELDDVVFEVSVLTPPQIIKVRKPQEYCKKIKVGEDGLIVESGAHKGLLLPQVPVEWRWDVEEFLCNCCNKAGLFPDHWLREGTKIYKFQAVIFEEEEPHGAVKEKAFNEQ